MGFAFNPFTGNFDAKGSGGGGAQYIDGEVATYSDLPLDGTAALNSAWLVREASGIWPVSRKQAGIYIRTATAGSSRDADYTYAGTMPDVFSDANFVLYDNGDSTKNLQFQLSGITTATTRTLTVPDASGTIARTEDFAAPPAIGNTTRNTVAATTMSATGAITGAVAGTTSATSGCNGFQIPVPAAGGASAVGMYGAFTAGSQRAVIFGANTTGSTLTIADFSASGLVANSIQNTPIGSTTPAAATFTNLTANTRVNLPNTNGTTAGDIYRNANTIRYRDGTNTERLLLNASDNLANLASAATSRTNLGVGSSDAVTFGSIQGTPIGSTTAAAITGTTGTFSTLSANNGTLTASAPALNIEQTWNNAATTFIGATINANVTAAAATSRVFRVQIDGTERFYVTRWGEVQASAGFSTGGNVQSTFGNISLSGQAQLYAGGSYIIEQRTGANAQTFRLYGTYTSDTNYQRMTVKSVRQTLSALSGASATTTGTFIPDGAVVVGITTRVATAITGATGYLVGDGTDSDRWGDITGTAIGTTSDNINWTAGTIECFTAGGNVTLTAKTSNFTAGAVEICVFYLAGEAD